MKIFFHKHLHNFPLSDDFLVVLAVLNSFRTFFFFFCRTKISYQFFFLSFIQTRSDNVFVSFFKKNNNIFEQWYHNKCFCTLESDRKNRRLEKLNENEKFHRVKTSIKLMCEEKQFLNVILRDWKMMAMISNFWLFDDDPWW